MSDLILTDDPQGNIHDIEMAKQIAEALHQHYPGHMWGVTCDHRTGMADIVNLRLRGNWGFRMHLKGHYSASYWKHKAIMAGGELLERFKLRRGKYDHEQYMSLATDRLGNPMGETTR